jgi:outer membrane protein insertion porin family
VNKVKAISCFLILLFLPNLFANDLSLGPVKSLFKVQDIVVEGTKKVESEAVLEKLKISKGDKLDNHALRDAIKTIYRLSYFEEVEAYKEKRNGKNVLVIKVKEKPVITRILFKGNDEVGSDDLKAELKTQDFNILDINTIKKDVKRLQEFYEEKGFYLASINYELRENEQKNLDLIFKVKEFEKVRVKKIMFLGNKELRGCRLKGNLCKPRRVSFLWLKWFRKL